MGRAWFTDYPDSNIEFDDLTIFSPKITNAYFAKKVVTAGVNGAQPTVAFEQISEGILGRDVYVIVETEDFYDEDQPMVSTERESIIINLKSGDTNLQVQNYLEQDGANGITVAVGDLTALNDNEGNCPYSNTAEFMDKAILKVAIRPGTRAEFDNWAQDVNNEDEVYLTINVKPEDEEIIFTYGFSFTQNSGSYPDGYDFTENTYTLENKNVYEIYNQDNAYNFNDNFNDYGNTSRRKPISKIENESTNDVVYFYKDLNDNEHEVCNREIFETIEKDAHTIPANYNLAQTAFEDILLSLNPHPTIQNANIPIFRKDYTQTNDALVQNNLTVNPTDLFLMLTDYRNLINTGTTDAQILSSLATQPQNIQTLVNNSNAIQRQHILLIENVVDQTSYALEGVDARMTCEYPLGVITSGDTKPSNNFKRYYRNMNINTPIKLIDVQIEPLVTLANQNADQLALNYTNGNLSIRFSYRASRRRYANPDLFAGFIGALAQLNYAHTNADVISTGFSFEDASCYPSSTHVNGANHDDHLHSYRFNRYNNQNNRNFIKPIL